MKKYLLLLITFLTSFIFFTNVKASGALGVNTSDIEKVFITKEEYKKKISKEYANKIDLAIESFNITEDDYYIIYGSPYIDSQIECYKWSKTSNAKMYLYFIKNYKTYYMGMSLLKNSSDNEGVNYRYKLYNDELLDLTNIFKSDYYYGNTYIYNKSTMNSSNMFVTSTSDMNYIFSTNAPIYYTKEKIGWLTGNFEVIDSLSLCDDELCYLKQEDEILVKEDGSLNLKNNYSYDGLIDTTNISKVKINFKNPDISENGSFNPELDFFLQYYGETDLIKKPVLNYKFTSKETGNILYSNLDFLNDNERNKYQGELNFDYTYYYSNFNIVIDTYNYNDNIYLKFSSALDFDIEFEYLENVNDYYKTINMNDIYGIYFIPNSKNHEIYSTIYLNGIYDIGLGLVDSKELSILNKDYSYKTFVHNFQFTDKGYLLYFENKNYSTSEDDNYYITFDTRYYNYSIKEYEFDKPIINNPVTGEDIEIDSGLVIDKVNDPNSFLDYIEKIFDGNSIKEIFNNIYDTFRKSRISTYLFIILVSSIILFLIKSMK